MADDIDDSSDFTIFTSRLTLIAMSCSAFAILLFYINSYKISSRKKGEVVVFTRYPVPGKSKTRLIPAIGDVAASRLQVFMVCIAVYTILNDKAD